MNASTSHCLIGALGVVALVAGFLLSRGVRPVVSERAPATISESPTDDVEQVASVKIHPSLLKYFGKANDGGEGQGPRFDHLNTEDFPDAFVEAFKAGNYDATGPLIDRWAELDISGMVEFFLTNGSMSMTVGAYGQRDFTDQILRLLVEKDSRGAWDIAKRFPRDQGAWHAALKLIGSKEPQLAVDIVLANLESFVTPNLHYANRGGTDFGDEVNQIIALELAKREPFGETERAVLRNLKLGDDADKSLAKIWSQLSPDEKARTATSFIPEVDDGSDATDEIYQAVRDKLKVEVEHSWSSPMPRFFDVFAQRLIGDSSLAEAIDWASENVNPQSRWQPKLALLRAAMAAGTPIEEITAQFEPGDGATMNVMEDIAMSLARKNPEEALRWVAGLEENLNTTLAVRELGREYRGHSDEEIAGAASVLGGEAGSFLSSIAEHRVGSLGGQAALDWAQALPEGQAAEAAKKVVQQWAWTEPAAAWSHIESLPREGSQRAEYFEEAVFSFLNQPNEPRKEWVNGLDAAELQTARRLVQRSQMEREWREERLAELVSSDE